MLDVLAIDRAYLEGATSDQPFAVENKKSIRCEEVNACLIFPVAEFSDSEARAATEYLIESYNYHSEGVFWLSQFVQIGLLSSVPENHRDKITTATFLETFPGDRNTDEQAAVVEVDVHDWPTSGTDVSFSVRNQYWLEDLSTYENHEDGYYEDVLSGVWYNYVRDHFELDLPPMGVIAVDEEQLDEPEEENNAEATDDGDGKKSTHVADSTSTDKEAPTEQVMGVLREQWKPLLVAVTILTLGIFWGSSWLISSFATEQFNEGATEQETLTASRDQTVSSGSDPAQLNLTQRLQLAKSHNRAIKSIIRIFENVAEAIPALDIHGIELRRVQLRYITGALHVSKTQYGTDRHISQVENILRRGGAIRLKTITPESRQGTRQERRRTILFTFKTPEVSLEQPELTYKKTQQLLERLATVAGVKTELDSRWQKHGGYLGKNIYIKPSTFSQLDKILDIYVLQTNRLKMNPEKGVIELEGIAWGGGEER